MVERKGLSHRTRTRVRVIVALMLVACSALGAWTGPARADTTVSSLGGLALPLESTVAATVAQTVQSLSSYAPSVSGIRIALISSGVDTSVLPGSLPQQVTLMGSSGDPVGYGTYAASVLLQLAPSAAITSIGVYPSGQFNAGWLMSALQWLAANAGSFDAVLDAVPPSQFLDPVSAAIASGEWGSMSDAVDDLSLPGSSGPVLGAPLSGTLLAQETRGQSPSASAELSRFSGLVGRWTQVRQWIRSITAAGVSVVAPAGDVGPNPQTVLGLANLPEVIAAGGFDGQGVSARSAAGPSIDGHVKPDLLAPTGMVGLLPAGSSLASALGGEALLDGSLEPAWSAGEPLTTARARLDTTMTSAAIVAVATGGLAAQQVRDSTRQRGALTAAAVPLSGVPVWRQGDGVLRRVPDAAFAAATPLMLSHGDLGQEPDSGTWSVSVPVIQGSPVSASLTLTDFIGVGLDARPVITAAPSAAPPVTVSVGNSGVQLTAPLGSGSYQGGLYCGYTEVSLPGSSGTVSPTIDAYGIPQGVEQVPTCLVQGTQLDALGFYIHNTPAENLTIGLLPALPAGQSLLDHAMEMLPVDPLATRLFFRVTGTDGHAHFPNLPPGYYRVREWSDYGDPLTETLTSSTAGTPVTVAQDIGENPGYQSFDALVLSAVCSTDFDPLGETGSPCTQQYLDGVFGPSNVTYEKATGGYLVTEGPVTLRIVFGFLKKMPGPSVASRYVDLLSCPDFATVSTPLSQALSASWLNGAFSTAGVGAWTVGPSATDPQSCTGVLDPLAAAAQPWQVPGILRYPFNLTTPNYKAHLSLNFSYSVTNSFIVPVVVMGQDVSWGVVTPSGQFQLPSTGLSGSPTLSGITLSGQASGTASFDFHLLPKGVSQGTLYLVFLPPVHSPLSSATVGDVSFELDTWTNTLWPATEFPSTDPALAPAYPATGHTFTVSPNYSSRQITGACRNVDNGQVSSRVCEDWEVIVHMPKTNAALFDVDDAASGASLLGTLQNGGSAFFDPQRGVSDFTHVLAFASSTIAGISAGLTVPSQFTTNGRFWEQLTVPATVLSSHPGAMLFRIQDLAIGAQSTLFPQRTGPVPVAPYVPYVSSAQLLGG